MDQNFRGNVPFPHRDHRTSNMSRKTVVNPRSGSVFDVGVAQERDQVNESEERQCIQLGNERITREQEDILYHLGLSNLSCNLSSMFGDVRFVCMGGSHVRAERFAHQMAERFHIDIPTGCNLSPVGKTERFSMFKVSFIYFFILLLRGHTMHLN